MLHEHRHSQCPECSMGDFELGRLAADQELICTRAGKKKAV